MLDCFDDLHAWTENNERFTGSFVGFLSGSRKQENPLYRGGMLVSVQLSSHQSTLAHTHGMRVFIHFQKKNKKYSTGKRYFVTTTVRQQPVSTLRAHLWRGAAAAQIQETNEPAGTGFITPSRFTHSIIIM